MQEEEILDSHVLDENYEVEDQYVISAEKFGFLSIITFGIYEVWWFYKAWKFFKEKEKLDVMPVPRAIFSIIFMIPLFNRIQEYAIIKGYGQTYSSGWLFAGFLGCNLLSRLPDPFWLISLLSFVFAIAPFKALNYAKLNSTEFRVIEQASFSGRQLGLIVFGVACWALLIYGMLVPEDSYGI